MRVLICVPHILQGIWLGHLQLVLAKSERVQFTTRGAELERERERISLNVWTRSPERVQNHVQTFKTWP